MIPLPGYQYVRQVGEPGNFGTVYHARNALTGQDVAIKHIDQPLSPDALASWEAEARAMAACEQENIVRIFHAEVTADGPALVMEYLPGGSVAAKYGGSAAPVGDVVQIAIDACWGLHRLHLAGLTHRDIKPGNLLIQDGVVKVGDFGLAAQLGDPANLVYVPHKPPELNAGDPWPAVADVYALAVTGWRLLWGDAHCGRHDGDFLAHCNSGHWPDRQAWPLHVHKRLRTALRSAMNPEPSKRPTTAADFRSTLEKARPLVNWVPIDDTAWHGVADNATWSVELVTNARGTRFETTRDLGNGQRRVRSACGGPLPEPEARRSAEGILEALASNGTV